MASRPSQQKSAQPAAYPAGSFLVSYGCASSLSLTTKNAHILKRLSQGKGAEQKSRQKTIHQENCRLTAKIIQIHQRKPKKDAHFPHIPSKKMINPERNREIQLENQRLGRSLVMIKTGKSYQRIKTQIAQSILKMTEKCSDLRTTTAESQRINLFIEQSLPCDPQASVDSLSRSIDVDSIGRGRRRIEKEG